MGGVYLGDDEDPALVLGLELFGVSRAVGALLLSLLDEEGAG